MPHFVIIYKILNIFLSIYYIDNYISVYITLQ